uniref:Putative transcriptional regulatory protein BCG9842_B4761 n=1 Tax=Lygus hesperus TaxID=30085 RepID=A0A0A9Y411_LYGHE
MPLYMPYREMTNTQTEAQPMRSRIGLDKEVAVQPAAIQPVILPQHSEEQSDEHAAAKQVKPPPDTQEQAAPYNTPTTLFGISTEKVSEDAEENNTTTIECSDDQSTSDIDGM